MLNWNIFFNLYLRLPFIPSMQNITFPQAALHTTVNVVCEFFWVNLFQQRFWYFESCLFGSTGQAWRIDMCDDKGRLGNWIFWSSSPLCPQVGDLLLGVQTRDEKKGGGRWTLNIEIWNFNIEHLTKTYLVVFGRCFVISKYSVWYTSVLFKWQYERVWKGTSALIVL